MIIEVLVIPVFVIKIVRYTISIAQFKSKRMQNDWKRDFESYV